MKCERCGVDLTKAIDWFGLDAVKLVHERVHLRLDLEAREVQLANLQAWARKAIDRWESGDLAEAIRELDALTPEVLACPHCEGVILDVLTKQDECPHCGKTLTRWRNHYRHCGEEWEDDDCDSQHNDRCPKCDEEIEPFESEEVEPVV